MNEKLETMPNSIKSIIKNNLLNINSRIGEFSVEDHLRLENLEMIIKILDNSQEEKDEIISEISELKMKQMRGIHKRLMLETICEEILGMNKLNKAEFRFFVILCAARIGNSFILKEREEYERLLEKTGRGAYIENSINDLVSNFDSIYANAQIQEDTKNRVGELI